MCICVYLCVCICVYTCTCTHLYINLLFYICMRFLLTGFLQLPVYYTDTQFLMFHSDTCILHFELHNNYNLVSAQGDWGLKVFKDLHQARALICPKVLSGNYILWLFSLCYTKLTSLLPYLTHTLSFKSKLKSFSLLPFHHPPFYFFLPFHLHLWNNLVFIWNNTRSVIVIYCGSCDMFSYIRLSASCIYFQCSVVFVWGEI